MAGNSARARALQRTGNDEWVKEVRGAEKLSSSASLVTFFCVLFLNFLHLPLEFQFSSVVFFSGI
jgi:hypothetical protein